MFSDDKKIVKHEDLSRVKEKIVPRYLNENKSIYLTGDGTILIGTLSDDMRSILDGINLTLAKPSNNKNNYCAFSFDDIHSVNS